MAAGPVSQQQVQKDDGDRKRAQAAREQVRVCHAWCCVDTGKAGREQPWEDGGMRVVLPVRS